METSQLFPPGTAHPIQAPMPGVGLGLAPGCPTCLNPCWKTKPRKYLLIYRLRTGSCILINKWKELFSLPPLPWMEVKIKYQFPNDHFIDFFCLFPPSAFLISWSTIAQLPAPAIFSDKRQKFF